MVVLCVISKGHIERNEVPEVARRIRGIYQLEGGEKLSLAADWPVDLK